MSEKAILRIDNAQKYYNRGRENEIHVMNGISLSPAGKRHDCHFRQERLR